MYSSRLTMIPRLTIRIYCLILFLYCVCLSIQSTSSEEIRRKPKYTEIRRPARTTTTTEVPLLSEDDDEDEIKPQITGNGRGGLGDQIEKLEPSSGAEIPENSKTASNTETESKKITEFAGRRYVEYSRPGSRKQRPRTTRAPTTVSVLLNEESEEEDDNKRPDACNECRFYCKRCRGAEEVTSGGVWGCCNHNCCGGRCSCQKVKGQL